MRNVRRVLSDFGLSTQWYLLGMVLVLVFAMTSFILAERYKEFRGGQEPASVPTLINTPDRLARLHVSLPAGWSLDTGDQVIFYFVNEQGERRGSVSAYRYTAAFDLTTQLPNHSSVAGDEWIDIPLGKARLITLDADNGSAASGATGTHDVYYASIAIEDVAVYLLDFTCHDRNPETKAQFIELLTRLRIDL
jgi:hypothetical protein